MTDTPKYTIVVTPPTRVEREVAVASPTRVERDVVVTTGAAPPGYEALRAQVAEVFEETQGEQVPNLLDIYNTAKL